MERRSFNECFAREVEPALAARGFRGAEGHLVRRVGDVEQVIEVQLSVYGTRVTANLGLHPAWLEPVIRWVSPSRFGPRAHDCIRWIRLGLAGPRGRDHWWSFDTEPELARAIAEMKLELLGPGLEWLERSSARESFLADARARLERSKGPKHPHGRFGELRVYSAILAWGGAYADARQMADHARVHWDEERARLEKALAQFQDRYPPMVVPEGQIPDLPAELDRLISPTRGVGSRPVEPATPRS